MKEFIDKLIGRLEERKQDAHYWSDSEEDYFSGKEYAFEDSISIVNELAEEYGKKNAYEITLNGCDDDTYFVMAMTDNEYEFLSRVSELANETSTYGCMPRLYVEKVVAPYTEGE